MTNTKRHPDFIKLKHKIQSSEKPEQLERLRQVVLRYGHTHADRAELMAYFLEKEYDLNPEQKNESMADETSIESMQHKNLSPQ